MRRDIMGRCLPPIMQDPCQLVYVRGDALSTLVRFKMRRSKTKIVFHLETCSRVKRY